MHRLTNDGAESFNAKIKVLRSQLRVVGDIKFFRAEILFKQFDDIKQLYYLTLQLGQIYSQNYDKNVAREKLALWFNKVEEWNYP